MPQSVLSASRVLELLDPRPDRAATEALLFQSKAELVDWTDDALTVSVTPDRIDLLSEGGLAFHLQGALGQRTGLPALRNPSDVPSDLRFEVAPSVDPLRSEIGGAYLEAPEGHALDAGLLAEAIRFQEILHATVGGGRRTASLGIYPIEALEPPIRYAREPISGVRFTPLDATSETEGAAFFAAHPMAAQYGAWGRSGDECLTLRDRAGRILSLPPILNSREGGEAKVGDRRLLIESTGTRRGRVDDAVGMLILPFVARGWSVAPVPVTDRSGRAMPGIGGVGTRSLHLTSVGLAKIAGTALPPGEVERELARCRLSVHPEVHGYRVEVPPWRPDLLAEVDLAEDVLLSHGVRPEDGLLPPSPTRGRRRSEYRFRLRVGELLLGLGSSELYTPVLVSGSVVRALDRSEAIGLENPVSEDLAHLRDAILASLVQALGRNVRHGYPQRFHEIGPVVRRAADSEIGADTHYHAGWIVAGESAGFATVAGEVDYVLRAFGALGVREPVGIGGTIPGRSACVRVAGEPVAELGELHPTLLESSRVPVPAAWAEVDLTALWPLVRRGETD